MTPITNPSHSLPSDTDFYVSLTAIETFGPDELLGVERELGMNLADLKSEVNEYRTINHGKADLKGVSAAVRPLPMSSPVPSPPGLPLARAAARS